MVDVEGQIFATTVEFYRGSPIRVEEVLLGILGIPDVDSEVKERAGGIPLVLHPGKWGSRLKTCTHWPSGP